MDMQENKCLICGNRIPQSQIVCRACEMLGYARTEQAIDIYSNEVRGLIKQVKC